MPTGTKPWRIIGQLENWIALAAILALIATVTVMFDALDRLAHDVDNTDRQLTRQTAQAAINSVSMRLRDSHRDYANWDDAVLNFHGIPDKGFVDENMRGSTETGILFDTAFLIDEKGNDLAAFHDGAALMAPSREYFGKPLQRLIRDIDIGGAHTHSGFAATPHGIAAIVVGLVWPFTEDVSVPKGERRVLVFARHLTTERVEKLRQEFVIPGLALVGSASSAGQGLPIVDPSGQTIASVVWTIRSPGGAALAQVRTLVWRMLGLLEAVIGAILAVTWLNVRRTSVGKNVAEHAARHDFLTGLANRAALIEILERENRLDSGSDNSVAILFFDLDGFKNVNDTHGHDAGDRLLQYCAKKFLSLTAGRGLVARVGGDEFVILVSGAESRKVAGDIAQGIIKLFSAPISVDGGSVSISTSIGVSHRLGGEVSAIDLLKRADTAMYEAKRRGGNSIACYDRDGGAERKRDHDRITGLREVTGSHSVMLAYRPVVDAAREDITGITVQPIGEIAGHEIGGNELQRLVEEQGYSRPFRAAVLEKAFTDAFAWQGIRLYVRLPGALLRTSDFSDKVGDALRATGFPANRLTIEIAETDIGGRRVSIRDTLVELRRSGVSLALRGFGAGESSLGVLQRIKFDELALDSSLAGRIVSDSNAQRLIQGIVAIATALELSVTAHGVENRDQAKLLRLAGCSRLEGPCFGHAMTAEGVTHALADKRISGEGKAVRS